MPVPTSVRRLLPVASWSARATPKSASECVAVLQEDVLRLDVAVDDAGGMRAGECTGGLGGQEYEMAVIDRELRLAIEELAERFAVDVRA